jgi:effector-binding domain-containing protein
MLTLPKLVDRPAQPYVAVRQQVLIPFDQAIGPAMGELFDTIETQKLQQVGPAFFKFNIVKMPELEIEFGAPIKGSATPGGRFVTGVLPAGRYVEMTYFGHYDDLMEVTALLIGWAKHKGIQWDMVERPDGEHFAARLEIYHNSPEEEPDPAKWETTLLFKVKD